MECITVLPQCRRGIDLRAHRAECQASRLGVDPSRALSLRTISRSLHSGASRTLHRTFTTTAPRRSATPSLITSGSSTLRKHRTRSVRQPWAGSLLSQTTTLTTSSRT